MDVTGPTPTELCRKGIIKHNCRAQLPTWDEHLRQHKYNGKQRKESAPYPVHNLQVNENEDLGSLLPAIHVHVVHHQGCWELGGWAGRPRQPASHGQVQDKVEWLIKGRPGASARALGIPPIPGRPGRRPAADGDCWPAVDAEGHGLGTPVHSVGVEAVTVGGAACLPDRVGHCGSRKVQRQQLKASWPIAIGGVVCSGARQPGWKSTQEREPHHSPQCSLW